LKTLTIVVEEDYVRKLDMLLKKSGLYNSRSEFLKDAIREKTIELLEQSKGLDDIETAAKTLSVKVKKRGEVKKLTPKAKDKIAQKYFEKFK